MHRPLVAMALAVVLGGCMSAREVVDGGTAAVFRGNGYLAVDGSRFDVDAMTLQAAGPLDSTNLQDTDRTAYLLPGVDPSTAFVVRQGDGTFVVFAPKQFFAPGQRPLGQTVPAICPFLFDPSADGCPSP